jgi:hypothetical protein
VPESPPPLPLERAVAVLRVEESPPIGARERLRARIAFAHVPWRPGAAAAAIGGARVRELPPAAAPTAAPAAWITRRSSTLALVTFLVGGGVGAAVHAALVRPSQARSPAQARFEARASREAPSVVGPTVGPPSSTAMPAAPPPARSGEQPRTRPPVPAYESSERRPPGVSRSGAVTEPTGSQLTAERRLLDRARADIVAEEAEAALEVLQRHRSTFPNGILADERDALSVEALVGARRYAEARRLAREFTARTPGSLFALTVRSAIESIPVTDDSRDANPR